MDTPQRGTIYGVSHLTSGALRMVDSRHDKGVSMMLPPELVEAWTTEAKIQGKSRTALFEDLLLKYLYKQGWDMPSVKSLEK